MARSRNIKPGFFLNDSLGALPPLARLMFAGLWTACDREGRILDRPTRIKAEVLPYDACNPDELLSMLAGEGFIDRYEAGGVKVIQVCAWDKHQNPHVKEQASTLPRNPMHQTCTMHAPGMHATSTSRAEKSPELAGLIPSSLIPSSLIPYKDTQPARKRAAPVGAACPISVSEDVWRDWVALRKAKRAPVSPTVVAEAESEAMKAGMSLEAFLRVWCARGSQGLQAEWLKPHEVGAVKSANSVALKRETDAFMAEQRQRDKVLADPAEQAKIAALIASRRPRSAA